jgi:hypothetical protein
MRRLFIFIVLIVLTGGMLFAFEGASWETVARLFIKTGTFYFLEKNAENNYRLFMALENTTLALGKGFRDSRGIVFAGQDRPKVILFELPGQPELKDAAPKPGLLVFVAGYTFSFSEKPAARLGHLGGRKGRIIAGSFKDDSILLEETGAGPALAFFEFPSHFIYIQESDGRYRRYAVDKFSPDGRLVFSTRGNRLPITLSVDWNEQGKAVGKITLADKSTVLLASR